MIFEFTAMDARGERLRDTVDAVDLRAAQQDLLRRGLFVLNIEPRRGGLLRQAVADATAAGQPRGSWGGRTPNARAGELALFARQMAMMLRAGATLVPSVRSIEEQAVRPAWRALLCDLADRLEGGQALHDAMARHPRAFPGQFRSIVAAGEATGTLADAFQRLSALLVSRLRTRRMVLSALAYPCVLLVMCISVVCTMTLFVLPRFADLFTMLDTPLPWITRFMLDSASWLKLYWPGAVGATLAAGAAAITWLRSAAGRRTLGVWLLRLPVIGRATAGVVLSQLLQLWAALLRSRVPLLETIQQTREATSNVVFMRLVAEIEQAIIEGRPVSQVLKQSRLVPAPVVAAVATGEESGKLGESMEFVGNWLEEENDALLRTLARTIEPAILVVMGVVVGGVAVALFLPLFDVATAGG